MTVNLRSAPVRTFLVMFATLRLIRFVTKDSLGEWTIRRPANRWAMKREAEEHRRLARAIRATEGNEDDPFFEEKFDMAEGNPITPELRAVSGLSCPHCVGFWIGALTLLADILMPRRLRKVWSTLLAALGLSYITGHISERVD